MSTKYKINNPEGIYFISFAIVNWIDVFTRKEYKDIFVESINFCIKNKSLVVYSWVIMSNHVHLILSAKNGNLSDIIRDLKKYTSSKIIKAIIENPQESRKEWLLRGFKKAGEMNSNNKIYQFWKQDNQPKELLPYLNSFAQQKIDYIHNNPVVAGIVVNAEDYLYSSAKDYAGMNGLIKIKFLE